MKDTISLLIATTILAVGGIGLYMYKSNDDESKEGSGYDEDGLFGLNGFFGSGNEEAVTEPELNFEDEERDFDFDFYFDYETPKPRQKARGGKTKRNKKNVGTKRRY